jgi:hypothetical protein
MAQPERPDGGVPTRHLQDGRDRRGVPDVQGEGNATIDPAVEVLQGGDPVRKMLPSECGDRATPQSGADPSIVVQHRNSVGRTPHVALQTRGAHPDRRLEGLE